MISGKDICDKLVRDNPKINDRACLVLAEILGDKISDEIEKEREKEREREQKSNIILLDDHYVTGKSYTGALFKLKEFYKQNPSLSPLMYTLKDGRRIVGPPSLAKLIRLKVEDYNRETDEEIRKRCFVGYLGTCTAVAHLHNTTQKKLIPISERLLTLTDYENTSIYLTEEEYKNINFPELDSSRHNFKEAIWSAGVPDKNLLEEYKNILNHIYPNSTIMKVFGLESRSGTSLNPIVINNTQDWFSNLLTNSYMGSNCRFPLVSLT